MMGLLPGGVISTDLDFIWQDLNVTRSGEGKFAAPVGRERAQGMLPRPSSEWRPLLQQLLKHSLVLKQRVGEEVVQVLGLMRRGNERVQSSAKPNAVLTAEGNPGDALKFPRACVPHIYTTFPFVTAFAFRALRERACLHRAVVETLRTYFGGIAETIYRNLGCANSQGDLSYAALDLYQLNMQTAFED